MRTIVERRLRLPGRRCACPTNSALTLECAERGAANVRQLDERKRSTNCEWFFRAVLGITKRGGEMIKGSQLVGRAVIDMEAAERLGKIK